MSATVVPVEHDVVSQQVPALVLAANPSRAFLEIQNKDTGIVTFKFANPFSVPQSEVQTMVFQQVPTVGTWTISFTDITGTFTTTALAYNANAAAIQAALQLLPNIGANNVTVAGDYTATGFTFTFGAGLANLNVSQLVPNVSSLTNNLVQSTAIQAINFSIPPTAGTFKLSFMGDQTGELPYNINATALTTALNALNHISGSISAIAQDGTSKDFSITFGNAPLADTVVPLIQVVDSSLTGTANQASAVYVLQTAVEPASGTFILSDGTYQTTPLAWNCAAADVQTALQALPSIGAGNVTVAGINLVGGFTITYGGALANMVVPNLIFYPANIDDMDTNLLLADTLDSDDITAGLDEKTPDCVKATITVTTAGHGTDVAAITNLTTVAGGAPGPVSVVTSTTVPGIAPVNDGIDILAGGSVLYDAECPTDGIYMKSANNGAAVLILEG